MDDSSPVITRPAILELQAGPMLAPVLRRVGMAIAAQAGLGLDEIGDLNLVADLLGGAVDRPPLDGRLRVELSATEHGVALRVGPLAAAAAARLRDNLSVPEIGSVLERLAQAVEVETDAEGEYLRLVVARAASEGLTAPPAA